MQSVVSGISSSCSNKFGAVSFKNTSVGGSVNIIKFRRYVKKITCKVFIYHCYFHIQRTHAISCLRNKFFMFKQVWSCLFQEYISWWNFTENVVKRFTL